MSKRKVPIRYTSRDFESIREDLEQYAKRYYPDTFKDFSEASFGSLMMDTVAYVGDMLSFYVDYQANESFLDTAVEPNNIIRLAKEHGYRFQGSASALFGQDSFPRLLVSNLIECDPACVEHDSLVFVHHGSGSEHLLPWDCQRPLFTFDLERNTNRRHGNDNAGKLLQFPGELLR